MLLSSSAHNLSERAYCWRSAMPTRLPRSERTRRPSLFAVSLPADGEGVRGGNLEEEEAALVQLQRGALLMPSVTQAMTVMRQLLSARSLLPSHSPSTTTTTTTTPTATSSPSFSFSSCSSSTTTTATITSDSSDTVPTPTPSTVSMISSPLVSDNHQDKLVRSSSPPPPPSLSPSSHLLVVECTPTPPPPPPTTSHHSPNQPLLHHETDSTVSPLVRGCCSRHALQIVNIGPSDLIEGKEHLVLGLTWQVIKQCLLSQVAKNSGLQSLAQSATESVKELLPEEILLRRFNFHLKNSGYPRWVSNFTSDVQDSVCYAVLLHQLAPYAIDPYEIDDIFSETDLIARAERVLQLADRLECRAFVTPPDIANAHPRLNLAFVANLFNRFPLYDENDTPDGPPPPVPQEAPPMGNLLDQQQAHLDAQNELLLQQQQQQLEQQLEQQQHEQLQAQPDHPFGDNLKDSRAATQVVPLVAESSSTLRFTSNNASVVSDNPADNTSTLLHARRSMMLSRDVSQLTEQFSAWNATLESLPEQVKTLGLQLSESLVANSNLALERDELQVRVDQLSRENEQLVNIHSELHEEMDRLAQERLQLEQANTRLKQQQQQPQQGGSSSGADSVSRNEYATLELELQNTQIELQNARLEAQHHEEESSKWRQECEYLARAANVTQAPVGDGGVPIQEYDAVVQALNEREDVLSQIRQAWQEDRDRLMAHIRLLEEDNVKVRQLFEVFQQEAMDKLQEREQLLERSTNEGDEHKLILLEKIKQLEHENEHYRKQYQNAQQQQQQQQQQQHGSLLGNSSNGVHNNNSNNSNLGGFNTGGAPLQESQIRDLLEQKEKEWAAKSREGERIRQLLVSDTKKGYLYKQSPAVLKGWQLRYFMLKDYFLYWYKDESEMTNSKPRGILPAEEIRMYELDEKEAKKKHAFLVSVESQQVKITLAGRDEDDTKAWMNALRMAKKHKLGIIAASKSGSNVIPQSPSYSAKSRR